MKKENETVEAEIVEEVINAPVLVDGRLPVSSGQIEKLLNKYKDIPDIDPESEEAKEQYAFVKTGSIELAKARNEIEKKRKEITDPAFNFHKAVKAVFDKAKDALEPTETRLKLERAKYEGYEAQKKQEAWEAEENRKAAIKEKIDKIGKLPLGTIGVSSAAIMGLIENLALPAEEEFNEFYENAITAYKTTILQLESAYDTAVKAENAEKIEAEARAKREAEELQQREEQRKEREAFEAEQRAFREKQEAADRAARAQQEEINRQRAEFEAEQLEARQKSEREEREKQEAADRAAREAEEKKAKAAKEKADKKLFESRRAETKKEFEKFEDFGCADMLIDSIIAGQIPNIKWVPNEQ